ncbi:hypothetical protein Q7P35_006281 [Cladosporium inversicolor]
METAVVSLSVAMPHVLGLGDFLGTRIQTLDVVAPSRVHPIVKWTRHELYRSRDDENNGVVVVAQARELLAYRHPRSASSLSRTLH